MREDPQEKLRTDPMDRRILHELQFDGRLSNKALAERTHMSESACLRHRQRLEAAGLIARYVAVLDQTLAGYPDTAFVDVALKSQDEAHVKAFEEALREIPEVMECHSISGGSDYHLRVVCVDAHDYERVRVRLAQIPAVDHIHTNFALRQVVKKTELPLNV